MSEQNTHVPEPLPKLLVPLEVARLMRRDEIEKDPAASVLRMARRGELEARRIGNRKLILRRSVVDWFARHEIPWPQNAAEIMRRERELPPE